MTRLSERILKELEAELIANRARYDVTIENFSENGMNVREEFTNRAVDYLPDETLDLEFKIPSREVLSLHCKVIWSSKISSESLKQNIGLEITENSPEYEDFFKNLRIDNNFFL